MALRTAADPTNAVLTLPLLKAAEALACPRLKEAIMISFTLFLIDGCDGRRLPLMRRESLESRDRTGAAQGFWLSLNPYEVATSAEGIMVVGAVAS
ncbi:hypothetical protein NDU88_002163 [Pleurodeles waltl]|uniref:Uncharacterized protein n=1 Tax=Pleurodeles waltl TaxID=8319 RepID=A0AAV7MNT2_PLEWA|nr:hypothetical protein NDU88_002163 [Pleurodeles waltl]